MLNIDMKILIATITLKIFLKHSCVMLKERISVPRELCEYLKHIYVYQYNMCMTNVLHDSSKKVL